MTARNYDGNGWFEVRENPISKVGVFPYYGRSLGPEYEPDRVYGVLRSEDELSSPETMESFRLLPIVDDHEMLGKRGSTAAEEYGVHGTLGDNVTFRDGVLYSNIKIFSDDMSAKIDRREKVELSCGYFCEYEKQAGNWNGEPYDVIQRQIRGNHVALVGAGRMGSDVRVLDHMDCVRFALDSDEVVKMSKKTPRRMRSGFDANELIAKVTAMVMDATEEAEAGEDTEGDKPEGTDAEGDKPDAADETNTGAEEEAGEGEGEDTEGDKPEGTDAEGDKPDAADTEEKPAAADKGMDAADVVKMLAGRDRLAKRLFPVTGAFDAAPMTLQAVAEYGVRKVGLKNVPKGHERSALDAYLSGREAARPAPTAKDSADAGTRRAGGLVGSYLSNSAKGA